MKKSDIPKTLWVKAQNEMRTILINRAKVKGLIGYAELASAMKSIKFDMEEIDQRGTMSHMYGELSVEQNKLGHGMISAIVVHKGDLEPGLGFYGLAEQLGRDTSDKLACWLTEVKKVHKYWAEHGGTK